MDHAKMIVTVEKEFESTTTTGGTLSLEGCRNCLTEFITELMVKDDQFREMINKAGKKANEIRRKIRASKEN